MRPRVVATSHLWLLSTWDVVSVTVSFNII